MFASNSMSLQSLREELARIQANDDAFWLTDRVLQWQIALRSGSSATHCMLATNYTTKKKVNRMWQSSQSHFIRHFT